MVIAVTKFAEGAWLVILLIPLLIGIFYGIHRHYLRAGPRAPRRDAAAAGGRGDRAVVPIADVGVQARQALAFARRSRR